MREYFKFPSKFSVELPQITLSWYSGLACLYPFLSTIPILPAIWYLLVFCRLIFAGLFTVTKLLLPHFVTLSTSISFLLYVYSENTLGKVFWVDTHSFLPAFVLEQRHPLLRLQRIIKAALLFYYLGRILHSFDDTEPISTRRVYYIASKRFSISQTIRYFFLNGLNCQTWNNSIQWEI